MFLEDKNFNLGPNTPGCTATVLFLSLKVFHHVVLHNHTKALVRKMAVFCTLQILAAMSTPSAPSLSQLSHCPHVQVPINTVQDRKGKASHSGSCTFPFHLLGNITLAGKKPTTKQNIRELTNTKHPNSFACVSIGELKLTACIDSSGICTGKHSFKNSKF